MKAVRVLASLVSVLAFSLCTFAGEKKLITGAGATFPTPLYTKWFFEYNKVNPDIEINYQSIGSGGGIKQLVAKTVDFGASDAPMTEDELKNAPASVVHIPTVLGAVTLAYNLPDLKKPIKMTGDVIAEIYMGNIKKWNDAKIAALNKDLKLPDIDVAVNFRADSSGTTSVFTDYLVKVSPSWKEKVGSGKAVKWPVGIGAKGNEGVTASIKNTPGSIGYIELTYAESQKLTTAEVQNKAGKFVAASIASVSEAAAGALKTMPEDFRVSITNAEGAKSYPISAFTYLLVYKEMPKDKGDDLVKFLGWAMDKGQKMAPELAYAPLPTSMVGKVKEKIKTISTK